MSIHIILYNKPIIYIYIYIEREREIIHTTCIMYTRRCSEAHGSLRATPLGSAPSPELYYH